MDVRKNWSRILGLLLIVVLVYWGANNLDSLQSGISVVSSAFTPFIIGGALAFILNLPTKFIENQLIKWTKTRKSWYRLIAIALSFLLVGVFIYLLIFLIIPDIQQTIVSFIEVVPETVRNIIGSINRFIENNPNFVDYVQQIDLDFDTLQQRAINTVQTFATELIGSTFLVVSSTIGSIVTVVIALIFAIYLLIQKETLIRQVKKLIYSIWSLTWANFFVNVGKKANEIFSNFVSGQLTEALILGLLVYFGMWIFGFPYRLSVAAAMGALALIPIYGAFLGGLVGVILISVVSIKQAFWFIVFILVVQFVEGNLIYPRVVGNSVGLPGIWVLMVVSVGGSLFGLIGMLIAVPTVSLIYTLISATVNDRLQRRNLSIETETSNMTKL